MLGDELIVRRNIISRYIFIIRLREAMHIDRIERYARWQMHLDFKISREFLLLNYFQLSSE